MLYALSWFVILSLLALWSLAAWAIHAVAVWTVANAGALAGAASGVEGLRLPEWLAKRRIGMRWIDVCSYSALS